MARILFWLSVVAGLVTTAVAWFVLPERVPLHFGLAGEVDRWGTRTEAVVTSGLMVLGLVLLFQVLAVAVPRTPETLLNLPSRDKQWWLAAPERREELNRRLAFDLYLIGAMTLFFIVGVETIIIVQAQRENPALGPWFMVVLAVYLAAVLGYTGYLIAIRYRAPRGGRTP